MAKLDLSDRQMQALAQIKSKGRISTSEYRDMVKISESYDLNCISCLLPMEKVSRAVPNLRAKAAGSVFSKKNQT